MTQPTSFAPLRTAVTEALTTSTGKPRAIGANYLFTRATAADTHQRAVTTKAAPRALVVVKNATADTSGSVLQGQNIWRAIVRVEITIWYYAGSELMKPETDHALDRIDADALRICAALCQPGALVQTAAGDATGLDGGSLRMELWTSTGPDLLPVQQGQDSGRRIFRVVHAFTTGVELQAPT